MGDTHSQSRRWGNGARSWLGDMRILKTPFFIKSALPEPLVFAGIWDIWKADEKEMYSFSIVTCEADGLLKDIHNRMPLMLVPDTANQWLTGNIDDAQSILHAAILHTAEVVDVQFYQVDPMIGNTHNQGPDLINPSRDEQEDEWRDFINQFHSADGFFLSRDFLYESSLFRSESSAAGQQDIRHWNCR